MPKTLFYDAAVAPRHLPQDPAAYEAFERLVAERLAKFARCLPEDIALHWSSERLLRGRRLKIKFGPSCRPVLVPLAVRAAAAECELELCDEGVRECPEERLPPHRPWVTDPHGRAFL